jgi:hypothetical protein
VFGNTGGKTGVTEANSGGGTIGTPVVWIGVAGTAALPLANTG